jgi:hypothetical protein
MAELNVGLSYIYELNWDTRTTVACFEIVRWRKNLFNLLKTKSRPLYLKAQFVPRCKHFSSRLQKTEQFMA